MSALELPQILELYIKTLPITFIHFILKLKSSNSRMKNMHKISTYQLFTITFIFQLGTTVIFGFGAEAGRDAWIGQLVSLGLGLFVILLYITLMRLNPGLTLVQWFPAQFGRWIGIPIAFLKCYFLEKGSIDEIWGKVPSSIT
jgi:hypothetical protein